MRRESVGWLFQETGCTLWLVKELESKFRNIYSPYLCLFLQNRRRFSPRLAGVANPSFRSSFFSLNPLLKTRVLYYSRDKQQVWVKALNLEEPIWLNRRKHLSLRMYRPIHKFIGINLGIQRRGGEVLTYSLRYVFNLCGNEILKSYYLEITAS